MIYPTILLTFVGGSLAQYAPPQAPAYEQQQYGYAPPQHGYAPQSPQYQPAAPQYAPTEAAYDAKVEWDQFWANTNLCKAEFGLNKCLLDCHNAKHFFDGQRISNCIVQFVQGLCGDISTKRTPHYENGRVSITTDNCQTSAYADALLVMDRMSNNFDRYLLGSIKSQTWPFTAVQLAVDVTIERADCTIESFFYYVSQCSKNHYLDAEDVQCVETHLSNGGCTEDSEDDFDRVHLQELVDQGEDAKVKEYVHRYYGDANVYDALSALAEDYLNDGLDPLDVDFNVHTSKASIEVCPINYLWMNFGYVNFQGLQGIPEDCVAFHFPRDGPAYKPLEFVDAEPEKIIQQSKGDYFLEDFEEPEEPTPVLDPLTPKSGNIHKTCHKHFEFSKALYILAGHDIGNVCYTIDGYSIKFLESGNVEHLRDEWIHQTFITAADQNDLLEDGDTVPKDEIVRERTEIVPPEFATCYTASWRNQKTCVSHLTEWQMNVRCCKSYAQAKEDNTPKVYVTKAPLYAVPPPQQYYSTQAPPYYQQSAPQSYYQPQSLLEDNYETQAPAYVPPTYVQPTYTAPQAYEPTYVQPTYTAPQAYEPTYASPTYDTYTPEVYEYTHTVVSNIDQGTIVEFSEGGVLIENGDLVVKYNEWADDLLEAKERAENVTENATEYLTVLKKLYYQKHVEVHDYSRTFELPKVRTHKGYYVGNDHHSKNTCERLSIDIDFGQVIPLVVGHCYPQSCLLSQYVSCIENPADDYKRFRPTYPQQQAAPVYYQQQVSASTYRTLMSAEGSSVMSLATIGFVAGVVVVALIQFVSSGRSETQAMI